MREKEFKEMVKFSEENDYNEELKDISSR